MAISQVLWTAVICCKDAVCETRIEPRCERISIQTVVAEQWYFGKRFLGLVTVTSEKNVYYILDFRNLREKKKKKAHAWS